VRYSPLFLLLLFISVEISANPKIPNSYSYLTYKNNRLVAEINSKIYHLKDETPKYTLDMVRGNPKGDKTGFTLSFRDSKGGAKFMGGKLFYGLADLSEKYPRAKWKRESTINNQGIAKIDLIGKLQGKYDFIDWERKKAGVIFYRVADAKGYILYEGKFFFTGSSPFEVDPHSIIEGIFINRVTPTGVTISFETLQPSEAVVKIEGVGEFQSKKQKQHEIEITGLKPNRKYRYTVQTSPKVKESYSFKTAPKEGSREPFVFAFTSDSRSGISSGEREIAGVNAYMMRKIMPLISAKEVAFLHFTGDEINGYLNSVAQQKLEYVNWKRSTLPFASHIPVYTSMGNHEALVYKFDDKSKYSLSIDRFPFATESSEAIFAKMFVNPTNGPLSEDNASYDPNPNTIDFPTYKENVYYYIYNNIAMVSLNSNYWYAPKLKDGVPILGGNPHSYIMDNQLSWLKKTLAKLDQNPNIDFVFVTQHTPAFPNGGHVKQDMFYNGENKVRPYIADKNGELKPHPKGIIERRDELWKILMQSQKVVAILTGDEHNYARLEIKEGMPIYGSYRPKEPMKITRTIYQIHNGAAGAPYYAKETTPWNRDGDKYLKHFSTENAVVFFHVDGKKLELEVINPDTLDRIE